MDNLSIMKLARADFQCECGRRHRTDLKEIRVSEDALAELSAIVCAQKTARGESFARERDQVFIVADENTWPVAGKTVKEKLSGDNIQTNQIIFSGKPPLVPDENKVFAVLAALPPQAAVLIAVGSGSINDLVRFVSFKTQRPYLCVATAPSMDGYASSVAPMIHNNLKITYPAWGAAALLAPLPALTACPQAMLAAGLGDVLGKFTALADWRLGHRIEDDFYCHRVADLVLQTTKTSLLQAQALSRRDHAAVRQCMEALILTGIAMSYIGYSRPASGAEHHLAHFIEMQLMQKGRPPVLHGAKVGLMTPIVCDLYHQLGTLQPDFAKARAKAQEFSFASWAKQMQNVYGSGADEVIELGRKSEKNSAARKLLRIERLQNDWPEIRRVDSAAIPDPQTVRQALLAAGAPVKPSDLNIEADIVLSGIRHAAEMRDRYTILQLYQDLDLTDTAVAIAAKWLH